MTRVGRAKMEAHLGGSSCCWGSSEIIRAGLVLVELWATGLMLVGLMAAGLVLLGSLWRACAGVAVRGRAHVGGTQCGVTRVGEA